MNDISTSLNGLPIVPVIINNCKTIYKTLMLKNKLSYINLKNCSKQIQWNIAVFGKN